MENFPKWILEPFLETANGRKDMGKSTLEREQYSMLTQMARSFESESAARYDGFEENKEI